MQTKNVILTALLSFVALVLVAQISPRQTKADKLFTNYSYSKAIDKYLSIADKDLSVKQNLAESYYHLNDFKKSEEWSRKVVRTTGFTPEDVRRYAFILRINQNYPESENVMNQFYDLKSTDSRAIQAKNKMNSYPSILKDKRQFLIKNLDMNGPGEDFAPNFYKEDVVFASSRGPNGVISRNWNGNNFPYLNFYRGTEDEELELNDIKEFFPRKNKKWHEGPVSFNEEGTYMVYTRNNYEGLSLDKTRKLMLFTSDFKDGKWTDGVGMAFNSAEYSVGHGSLSPDGNTMYFASDMPGGFGSIDIYKTTRDRGVWSEPVNLGSKINTEGKEMFPFIDYKGKILFFASEGHYGLGGLDVFMSLVRNEKYSTPRNIGFPVNGSYDDFAMIIDKSFSKGYFTSNRPDGHGDDDIYSFKMLKPFCKSLRGTAKDQKTLATLSGVNVNLYDKDGVILESIETLADGSYEFCIDDTKTYALKGSKENYSDGEISANMNTDADEVISDLLLSEAPGFLLYDIVTDRQTGAPLNNIQCTMTSCDGSFEKIYYTSSKGNFTRELKAQKLNDEMCFKVLYEKPGYETKTVDYHFVLDHPGQYNIVEQMVQKRNVLSANELAKNTENGKANELAENAKNRTANELAVNTVNGTVKTKTGTNNNDEIWVNKNYNDDNDNSGEVVINPIYFDADKYNIRSDAKVELDKVVKLMTEYPNLTIELSSHTDCRASKKYNQELSQNRARASLKYIKERISNSDRIYGEGFGESRLANGCVCEPTNNSDCSSDQHQLNRRTEFVIISQ
jgi:outer membrane protein OmpA-like peptidoglycan-associated protein